MKNLFTTALLFFLIFPAHAQKVRNLSEGNSPGSARVENFSWLVGYWSGPGLGGECEEVWLPPVDGHMIGTFRFWSEGKLVFSEFMHLIQDGESVTLKLKHFNPDLSGWEEKEKWTTFSLIELGKEKAKFDGLTMERKGEELVIWVDLGEKGEPKLEKFTYRKKAL
ncbi:DUF6265 family protein [Algoriphagus hitonicola]|uniref:DUF6265 domain-containing protein n=1 Tax=Algoriphagus hitonicola TaxID=435880 RepID=A0A1I2PFM7_9BACT|nr:DUF6265 family protein [Algoriphagus hitonicola]SFG12221.1 hypothetical protein SAMN04487988_101484 [Algoriphagus hitonicola]